MHLYLPVVPLDAASIWVLLAFGVVIAGIFLVIVSLSEAVVLKLLKWGTFLRSLLASFLMNLASTLIGVGLVIVVDVEGLWFVVIAWAVSVVIEGGVLTLMKRDAGRQNWLAVLVANVASYLLLVLPLFLLSSLE